MPTKRRGGFRPPELRGTLGTLLRTTTGVVRDAIERGAREGRARLDDARANRRRQDTLADLGELVLDLIRRGEIDLAELPEARDLVRQLDELDADPDADPEPPPPPRGALRRRHDDRAAHLDRAAPTPDDDGTVSSGAALRAGRPTIPARPKPEPPTARAPTKPVKGMWRPLVDDDAPAPAEPARARPATTRDRPPPPRPDPARPLVPPDPARKGGISFDDDDLADYMHPDDVPPKAPAKDPADSDP